MAKQFPNPDQFWVKGGPSPNPSGRPKGAKTLKSRLTALLERIIEYKDLDGKPIDISIGDALSLALINKAIYAGDLKAIEMVRNEVEGIKPADDKDMQEYQKEVMARVMARMLPDYDKMKDVTK